MSTVTPLAFGPHDAIPCDRLGTVYSNMTHTFRDDVVAALQAQPYAVAQHAAWDYCGYITYVDGAWVEWVMRHHSVVAKYASDDLAELVQVVIEEWGDE
jgi:hypothetical protein